MTNVSCREIVCLFWIFLLNIQFFASDAQLENFTFQPEVTTPQGTLQGTILTTRRGQNFSTFFGIPYAQPPIGSLRFADPVAADDWTESRNATIEANICPQKSENEIVGDEDCLYLNVYTPLFCGRTISSLLPVMVYIHGGGFVEGSGSHSYVGPEYILDEDVLIVTPNHRLGALGFLSTGDDVAPGNWGLKDQVLALKWVQKNIESFGGDPDQVTLFGHSAGAAAVDLLAISNATSGLFRRCITQSGSAFGGITYRSSNEYSRTAFEFGDSLNCSNVTSDSLINCLRNVDFLDLAKSAASFSWGPTDEPDILTDSPENLCAAGKVRNVPQISGIVRDESLMSTSVYYEDEELFLGFLEKINSSLITILSYTNQPEKAAWVDDIRAYYLNDLSANKSILLSNLTTLLTDKGFHYPAYKALQKRVALGINPQYFYFFNYKGTLSASPYGITHSDVMNYLFIRNAVSSDLLQAMTEADYAMVDTMVQLWTNFAFNGTPTAPALNGTTWEPFSTEGKYYLRIGKESDPTPVVEYYPFEDRMQFWANLETILDTSTTGSTESGGMTSSPNLHFVLLVACSKFILSAVTVDRLG